MKAVRGRPGRLPTIVGTIAMPMDTSVCGSYAEGAMAIRHA